MRSHFSAKADASPWGPVSITASCSPLTDTCRRRLLEAIGKAMEASAGKDFGAMTEAVQEGMRGVQGTYFTEISFECARRDG